VAFPILNKVIIRFFRFSFEGGCRRGLNLLL